MTTLLLVFTALATAFGLALATGDLARGRMRPAVRTLAATGALVAVYLLAIVLVSLQSRPRLLAQGELKCFDDWCVTLKSIDSRAPGMDVEELVIVVTNHGRGRTQRPDGPRAFLVTSAGLSELSVPGLDQRLEPGQSESITLKVTIPVGARDPRLVITEGGLPSRLVVGDENSPWHAKSSWKLRG